MEHTIITNLYVSLQCTTIVFKQKYGHRSTRRADMNRMNLWCESVFTAEIGQYWVVGRRSWDCVIWRQPCSYIYIKHHTIEKYFIETSNRRCIFIVDESYYCAIRVTWVQRGMTSLRLWRQTNVGNMKNILCLWFSHFTLTAAHLC